MTLDSPELKDAVRTLLRQADLFEDAIREFTATSRGGVPETELYVHVAQNMSLDQFNYIIGLLVEAGKVKNTHHFLTHCG